MNVSQKALFAFGLLLIAMILVNEISPVAASANTITTTTTASATYKSYQRKSCYQSTRYWDVFNNGTHDVLSQAVMVPHGRLVLSLKLSSLVGQ
jgi:hypothetical protein